MAHARAHARPAAGPTPTGPERRVALLGAVVGARPGGRAPLTQAFDELGARRSTTQLDRME